MNKNIFIIAGEASGDSLGAGLMRELKAQFSGILNFTGVGGNKMKKEGLETLIPMDEIAVMGIWEVLWQLPRLLKIINGLVSEIEERQPDAVITIDAQDLSLQIAQRLKKRGIFKGKLVHYVAPTVWAWRPGRAQQIAAAYDLLLCLFPFEPNYFTPHNLNAIFVGHPLVEYGIENLDSTNFKNEYKIGEDEPVLGLFLGSRESEIKNMGKTLAEAASIVQEKMPGIHIIVPTLPALEFDAIKVLRENHCDATVVSNETLKWEAFAACDIGLAVSGTVGLELAYMGIPHVIGYKTHPVTFLIIRLLVKTKFAHLANILLDKAVVPEFLQNNCQATTIAAEILRLFNNEDKSMTQIKELETLSSLLQNEEQLSPSAKAATSVMALL